MPEWAKPFTIASLYRTDLARIGLTYEQIAALSNMDMLKLSQQLGVMYLQSVFVAHLQEAVNDLLAEKEQADQCTPETS